MEKLEKPIGDFILENSKGTQTEDGVYYHYTDVCSLLKKYKQQCNIHDVVVPKGTLCEHPFNKVVQNNNNINYCNKCDKAI